MNKTLISSFSRLFPRLVVSFAYKQLTNPQVKKLRANEEEMLQKAKREQMDFEGFNIQLYEWGEGDKKVLLIHGWEGQAGNFADLVKQLLDRGYKVFAFDAPSHGYSSRGPTSLFEFTELVGVLIRKHQVKTLVSHSFGGVATTYALYKNPDLKIDKYLLLTTPDRFIERIGDVAEMTGITEDVKKRLIARLEKETGEDVQKLNVHDFVQGIQVEKALIIHDRADKIIPIERSRNVCNHWKACKFLEVEGTGHFRILRSEPIHKEVMSFLDS